MKIVIVVAAAKNGAIGLDNKLLWHLPNDFKFFKNLTSQFPIIMGRKTFESIGKPLPNRTNIVVSSNFEHAGCLVANSLEQALNLAKEINETVFVIGGASIYQQALPIVTDVYLTEVDCEINGDAYFKAPNTNDWLVSELSTQLVDEKHKYGFKILHYTKS